MVATWNSCTLINVLIPHGNDGHKLNACSQEAWHVCSRGPSLSRPCKWPLMSDEIGMVDRMGTEIQWLQSLRVQRGCVNSAVWTFWPFWPSVRCMYYLMTIYDNHLTKKSHNYRRFCLFLLYLPWILLSLWSVGTWKNPRSCRVALARFSWLELRNSNSVRLSVLEVMSCLAMFDLQKRSELFWTHDLIDGI